MMKKIYILILLCLVSSEFFAQQVSYSKPIKLNNKTPRFRILGRNASFFVAERWGTKLHYLDLYNAKLKKVSSKEIKVDKDELIKRIWIQPKKGWIIYTKAFKDFTLLQAKQLDIKLNIRSQPIQLDSILERKDLVESNLRTTQSLNEKFVASYLPVFSNGEIDYFSVKVFDDKLKLLQNIKLKNDFIKKGAFVDLILMNDASVVIVFKKENNDNVFKIYYSNKDKNLKEYPLALANQVFKKVKFEVDNKNNKLLIAGLNLHEVNKRTKAADAFFTLTLDLETGTKKPRATEVFTKDFFKLLTGREFKEDKVSLQTFYIKKIVPKTDGGYIVFAESYYVNEKTVEVPQTAPPQSSGGTGTNILGTTSFSTYTSYKTNYYHYNDVIVYTISDSMSIESVNIIKKRQKSEEDNGGYSSFNIANQQNMLEVLFLDEISVNSSLKRYTFNSDSEIFKDYLLNTSQNNVMPVVKLAVQTAPNEVLIPSYLNNSFSLIKVIFEDN